MQCCDSCTRSPEYLIVSEHLDASALNVVNATTQLGPPRGFDFFLRCLFCLNVEGLQATMNHRRAITTVKGQQRLFNLSHSHRHMGILRELRKRG